MYIEIIVRTRVKQHLAGHDVHCLPSGGLQHWHASLWLDSSGV